MEALISACAAAESKQRAGSLVELLEALQQGGRGAAAEGALPHLAGLCATLASSFTDNNVKVSGGAAAVAEHLGGALPPGALRDGLATLVPPLAELLGNAKVRAQPLRAPALCPFARHPSPPPLPPARARPCTHHHSLTRTPTAPAARVPLGRRPRAAGAAAQLRRGGGL